MSEYISQYIIVGAGAAGCILAARLSENPSFSVLLLEAGRARHNPLLKIPAGETLLLGNSRYDWRFQTEPDPTLEGRRIGIPRGRLLGGSNAINGMIFVRGQAEDYEDWVRGGALGWGWRDVLPYFRKLENWSGPSGPARGAHGPISVSEPNHGEPLCDVFIAAARTAGLPLNPDYNSGQQEGCGVYQATVRDGVRSSTVEQYLRPALRRRNLRVLTDAHVDKLIFEGSRCVGVEFRYHEAPAVARCGSEVILAAGPIQSPQILELSGVGNATVLRAAGVDVRCHLPGVGENFHDHVAARLRWRVTQKVTYNERTRGPALLCEIARYLMKRRGVLSLPIAIGYAFARSSNEETRPDLQFHFAPASYGGGSTRRLERLPGMTLGVYPLRPVSRGSVHIASPNRREAPEIRPNFLGDSEDVRRLIAGIRLGRQIANSAPFDLYRGAELVPGAQLLTDCELETHLRNQADTSYHPVGTCRVGGGDQAVVDYRLRVIGLSGLRIADSSIMPMIVSGNTNATTMMIAEKAAAMIIEEVTF